MVVTLMMKTPPGNHPVSCCTAGCATVTETLTVADTLDQVPHKATVLTLALALELELVQVQVQVHQQQ